MLKETDFKNVFREPFASSINGSFDGNLSEPHNTECSKYEQHQYHLPEGYEMRY